MLRYNLRHVNESLDHQCRWHWLLKGVELISCIPNQYPWSTLVWFGGKIGPPIWAILLFPSFVMAIFASIERTVCLGLRRVKTLKFRCSLLAQGWVHMLKYRRLVSFELLQSLSCWQGAGRCGKDLQESFLPSSWRSGRITWGCQVAIAAYVGAAKSRLGLQAPKEDLTSSITSVYRATPFTPGHTNWCGSCVTLHSADFRLPDCKGSLRTWLVWPQLLQPPKFSALKLQPESHPSCIPFSFCKD